MLRLVIVAPTFVVVSWVVMIVLARRRPPALAKALATVLPACLRNYRSSPPSGLARSEKGESGVGARRPVGAVSD